MQILLGNSLAGPGRTVKQEKEEISRNHVQTFISPSVLLFLFLSPQIFRSPPFPFISFPFGQGMFGT